MIDFSTPLAGMNQASSLLDRTAARIAQPGSASDTVELSADAVALMEARRNFEANANVLKTEDQMDRSLLDIAI